MSTQAVSPSNGSAPKAEVTVADVTKDVVSRQVMGQMQKTLSSAIQNYKEGIGKSFENKA